MLWPRKDTQHLGTSDSLSTISITTITNWTCFYLFNKTYNQMKSVPWWNVCESYSIASQQRDIMNPRILNMSKNFAAKQKICKQINKPAFLQIVWSEYTKKKLGVEGGRVRLYCHLPDPIVNSDIKWCVGPY